MQQSLVADVSNLQGTYGVAVIDIASGAAYGVNGNRVFRAASVNKMPIIVTLYLRAASGQLKLDQTLSLADSDIQHYGTGTIQEPDAPRVYTLRQLGALMIRVSDNTAAYVLERLLGEQSIQRNAGRWRLEHTSMADNTTTPADAALLMADLYSDRFLPADSTNTILDLLKGSVSANRLDSGLPSEVGVAHKVGTDIGVYNDAGIVLLEGRPYAIAVLSEDADEAEANLAFGRVSRDVYAFQSSLGKTPR
jgi:beta-lactamase class A